MTRPAATIKSTPLSSGARTWKVRCFLHPTPMFVGIFGAPASWVFGSHQSRRAALAALASHQRAAHPCTDCRGLACTLCNGTGVNLTTTGVAA
jgi:hypothetical protein